MLWDPDFARFVLVAIFSLLALDAGNTKTVSGCDLSAQRVDLAGPGRAGAWFDANVRLNQIQQVGTAESYKLRPSHSLLGLIWMGSAEDAKELDFGEPAI